MAENIKMGEGEVIQNEPTWEQENALVEKVIQEKFGANRFTLRELLETKSELSKGLPEDEEKDFIAIFNRLRANDVIGFDKGSNPEMFYLKNSA
jgi:hypothetical protein